MRSGWRSMAGRRPHRTSPRERSTEWRWRRADAELSVECLHADANDLEPFDVGAFDLVTAHYASIPRTPDGRAISNLLGAVAPGGTLLVVGHDLEPMRTSRSTRIATVDRSIPTPTFASTMSPMPSLRSTEWLVDVHDKRERPGGHIAASHHVDDIVLRARRVGR